MSDFTTGAHECFCDRQYKDANKLESCGDCPRDYIAGAWDARRKYIEEHSKMTDRYENIRKALAMGPTPGPWDGDDNSVSRLWSNGTAGVREYIALPDGAEGSAPNPADMHWIAACDPDTIWALLEERDALAAENERLNKLRVEALNGGGE